MYQTKRIPTPGADRGRTVQIESISAGQSSIPFKALHSFLLSALKLIATADIEENGVRLKLTVVDTPGFGDFVNNDERCVCI